MSVKRTTTLGLLATAALATPLLAYWTQASGQDPIASEWQKHVDRACKSRRFGLRLAAARKVAAGGDAAVPAVRAFGADNGWNAVPVSLVDAIADGNRHEPAVRALLIDWAQDVDFYWRSAAMRGLALRVPQDPAQAEAHRELLLAYRDDPAWLMRTHARFGLVLAGADLDEIVALPEDDPRAPVRLARLLLERDKTPPLQPLFDALSDERTFLDIPWGQRLGQESHKALKSWLGELHPLANGGSFDDKQRAIETLRDIAGDKSGQSIELPTRLADDGPPAVGGIEIQSCKYGDQFVQWFEDGSLHFGIDGRQRAALSADAWRQLQQSSDDIALANNIGVVVCDSLRVRLRDLDVHIKIAPESLPEPATEWLKQLAQSLEEAGVKDVAANLRRGLGQFAAR